MKKKPQWVEITAFSPAPRMRKIMKLTALFLLGICMSVQATAYSQQTKVSFDLKDVTLNEVFKEITKQTTFEFLYSVSLAKEMKVNKLDVKEADLFRLLDQILPEHSLGYTVNENVVIINPVSETKSQQDDKNQPIRITGRVIDEEKSPLPGVTVRIKGTLMGTSTDADGKYSVHIPNSENCILVFSFIGKKEVEIPYTGQAEINVTLADDATLIDDIVVTGFFTRKKEGFSGAVTKIDKEELKRVSTGNIFATISAIDAGFKINEDNLSGSNPNVIPDFTIRGKGSFQNGSTSPVFMLDGFEVSAQKVFDLDINRIESITLLKDASATILYGSRAANGVIVIETIAPAAGKLQVTYDFKPTIAFADLNSYDLMNAPEKLQYEKEAGLYEATISVGYEEDGRRNQLTLDQQYNDRYKKVIEGVDTYWLSQPIQTSFSHAHSLFVEGGLENVRYGIDFSYNGNSGVLKKSGRDRIGLGFSLIYRIREKITIKNYLSYSNTKEKNSPYGSFSQYAKANPYEKIHDDAGNLIAKLSNGDSNPLYDALLPNRNTQNIEEFREQLNVDWNVNSNIRVRGQFAVVKGNFDSDIYQSPYSSQFLTSSYNSETRMQEYMPIAERGRLTLIDGSSINYSGNLTFNYNRVFNQKHLLYLGIGGEISHSESDSHGFTVTGFPDDRYSDPAFAIQFLKDSKPTSNESTTKSMGLFFTANYIFDERFFVDFSSRLDGSSRFGADRKYAPFWSVGGGWNIHKEKFFAQNNTFDLLKLRASYGITGNQEFSAYQAKTMFEFNTDRVYNQFVTANIKGYGNDDLKWQTQYQTNIGLDLGWLKNRIRAQFNYYHRETEGMLTSISVAPSLGFPSNSFVANVGKIRNQGLEANLNAVLIHDVKNDLEWSVMLQVANNKNKLIAISNELKAINEANNENRTTPLAVYEEGESMSAIKAVESLGIDPVTGKEMFVRKSDGSVTYTWDAADKIVCGDSEPKVYGNFGTNLFYKGWNLNLVFKYNLGGDHYNETLAKRVEGADPRYNADRRVLNDRWKEEGQHALYKNIKEYTTTFVSSRFVQKNNLVQLTSLSLSYEFNRDFLKPLGLRSLRTSFYMNDVFRISTVKNERGLDYPFQISYVFGLNVGF